MPPILIVIIGTKQSASVISTRFSTGVRTGGIRSQWLGHVKKKVADLKRELGERADEVISYVQQRLLEACRQLQEALLSLLSPTITMHKKSRAYKRSAFNTNFPWVDAGCQRELGVADDRRIDNIGVRQICNMMRHSVCRQETPDPEAALMNHAGASSRVSGMAGGLPFVSFDDCSNSANRAPLD
jgi:hypothetical protein